MYNKTQTEIKIMAFQKNLQNIYVPTAYENEGFLYIDTVSTETFKRGEIKDTNNNTICPGIIVPIVPIKEECREIGDELLVSIDSCIDQIVCYYPLEKCKKLRIYWVQLHEVFVVSTELQIYIMHDYNYDMSSVNFDLLDKTKCYYCVTDAVQGLLLTNIVDRAGPCLETSYDISEDLAFANHIDWLKIPNDKYATIKNMLDDVTQMDNGVWCVLKDGRQMEIRTIQYNYYCSLAKPENISISLYFIMCLNKYADGNNYAEYFTSLHDYVREFTDAYPEYTESCNIMSNKLRNYINSYDFEELLDLKNHINKILELEPAELLKSTF